MEMEAGSAIPYEEFESILYENLDIFTPNLRNPDARWIFPGKHVYKFSYQLPTDIPYTLDGSRYGRVEYKSKAELLIPGWNFFCLTTSCCFPVDCFNTFIASLQSRRESRGGVYPSQPLSP